MKSLILFLFVSVSLTGCGVDFMPSVYTAYTSSLKIFLESPSKCDIVTLQRNSWNNRRYKSLMPEYFSDEDKHAMTGVSKLYNYFYVKRHIGEIESALWVRIDGALEIERNDFYDFFGAYYIKTIYSDNKFYCRHATGVGVEITTNAVDIDFDTSEVYLIINSRKIDARLIKLNEGSLYKDTVYYTHGTYNLSDPHTIKMMQPRAVRDKFFPYPSFGFKFPLHCRDLENAVLVIGGFSYKGKPVPPLKIRMNYYDLAKVPAYEGPAEARQE